MQKFVYPKDGNDETSLKELCHFPLISEGNDNEDLLRLAPLMTTFVCGGLELICIQYLVNEIAD